MTTGTFWTAWETILEEKSKNGRKGHLESSAEQVLARASIIAPKTCAPNLDFGALAAAGARSAQWHPNQKNTQKGYRNVLFESLKIQMWSLVAPAEPFWTVSDKHIISHPAGALARGGGGGTPYMF